MTQLKKALVELNEGRQALDLPPLVELPNGDLGSPRGCVVYRGLELGSGERCGATRLTTTTSKAEALARAWWGSAERTWGGIVGLPDCLRRIASASTTATRHLHEVDHSKWRPLKIDPAYLPPQEQAEAKETRELVEA